MGAAFEFKKQVSLMKNHQILHDEKQLAMMLAWEVEPRISKC